MSVLSLSRAMHRELTSTSPDSLLSLATLSPVPMLLLDALTPLTSPMLTLRRFSQGAPSPPLSSEFHGCRLPAVVMLDPSDVMLMLELVAYGLSDACEREGERSGGDVE